MNCFLHIGQPKTGTSFLQACLANTDLAQHNICYPIEQDVKQRARQGKITSGNYRPMPGVLERIINNAVNSELPNLLISSESLFGGIASQDHAFLNELYNRLKPRRVYALCYVRNPVEHAVSVYQQMVKRGGFTGTFEESLAQYKMPEKTVRALSEFRAFNVDYTVLNYSNYKKCLKKTFEQWLGLPHDSLVKPVSVQVNRSLTNSELELQKHFNRFFGKEARSFISDPLCNNVADIQSDTPSINKHGLVDFLKRMAKDLNSPHYINFVPKNEVPWVGMASDYESYFPAHGAEVEYHFTSEQLAAIAKAISHEVRKAGGRGAQ